MPAEGGPARRLGQGASLCQASNPRMSGYSGCVTSDTKSGAVCCRSSCASEVKRGQRPARRNARCGAVPSWRAHSGSFGTSLAPASLARSTTAVLEAALRLPSAQSLLLRAEEAIQRTAFKTRACLLWVEDTAQRPLSASRVYVRSWPFSDCRRVTRSRRSPRKRANAAGVRRQAIEDN